MGTSLKWFRFVFCLLAVFISTDLAVAHSQQPAVPVERGMKIVSLPYSPYPLPPPAGKQSISWSKAEVVSMPPGEIGVLVCDPLWNSADTAVGEFGAGATRWLHYYVSGQGEFGKTPLWGTLFLYAQNYKRNGPALKQDEVAYYAKRTGLTHVVLTEVSGAASKASLLCYVAEIGAKQIIGEPIVLNGSLSEITAKLPSAARELCLRLGVRSPELPASAGVKAEEIQQSGASAFLLRGKISNRETDALTKLSETYPVAAIQALSLGMMTRGERDAMEKTVLQNSNGVVSGLGALCNNDGQIFGTKAGKETLLEALRKYPKNRQLLIAKLIYIRASGLDGEREAAKAVLDSSPNNGDANLIYASTIMREADKIRHARFIKDITQEEFARLEPLYAEWKKYAARAVELDPLNPLAWLRLATSATFNGDDQDSNKAIWKSLKLDPKFEEAYFWAMQMFQPKWGGDPEDLKKAARMAIEAFKYDSRCDSILKRLKEGGQDQEAETLRREILSAQKEAVRQYPDDYSIVLSYAYTLMKSGYGAEALSQYENLKTKFPEQSRRNRKMQPAFVEIYSALRRYPEAIAASKAYLNENPDDAQQLAELAYIHCKNLQGAQGIEVARKAISLNPAAPSYHGVLGDCLSLTGEHKEAIKEYLIDVKSEPENPILLRNLGYAYYNDKQYQKGTEVCERALKIAPEDADNKFYLLANLFEAKNYKRAEEIARDILALNPKDAGAYINLGELLYLQGKHKEAKAQWDAAGKLPMDASVKKELSEKRSKYP